MKNKKVSEAKYNYRNRGYVLSWQSWTIVALIIVGVIAVIIK